MAPSPVHATANNVAPPRVPPARGVWQRRRRATPRRDGGGAGNGRDAPPGTGAAVEPHQVCSATASTDTPSVAHPQGHLLRSVAHSHHHPSPDAPGTAQHTSDADGRGVPLALSRGRRASTDAIAAEASSLIKPRGRLSHPVPIIHSSL